MNELSRLSDSEVTDMLRRRSARPVPDGLASAVLESLASERARHPVRTAGRSAKRPLVLLAAAALLLVGGAMAAGSGLVRLPSLVPPVPAPTAPVAVASPTASPAPSETLTVAEPTPGMFAYILAPDGESRAGQLWVANVDGTGARRLAQDLGGSLGAPAWSPDGTRLVFSQTDMDKMGFPTGQSRLYLTDASGSEPQLVDTGCVAPCTGDTDAAFSRDGKRLVFVRTIGGGPTGPARSSLLATVDLSSGRVTELASTVSGAADYHPRWSPDGTRIVFTQDVPSDVSGTASKWGPFPAVFVVDADGGNFHQIGPAALTADWSPDGAGIVFESVSEVDIRWENYDIYTIRPDGSALRRLTSDQGSIEARWTADGRIAFLRAPKKLAPDGYVKPLGPPQFWVMDADGGNATQLSVSPKLINQLGWPMVLQVAWPISWPPQP